jgi:hypothetical protein
MRQLSRQSSGAVFKTVNIWLCRAKNRLLAPRRVWGHSGETTLDWSSLTWAGPADLAVVLVELFPQRERLERVAGAFERGEILVCGKTPDPGRSPGCTWLVLLPFDDAVGLEELKGVSDCLLRSAGGLLELRCRPGLAT